MERILEALYNAAAETPDRSRWLFNSDAANALKISTAYAEEHREQLQQQLGGADLELFERFIDNLSEQTMLEEHITFNLALAIGVLLGTLTTGL